MGQSDMTYIVKTVELPEARMMQGFKGYYLLVDRKTGNKMRIDHLCRDIVQ